MRCTVFEVNTLMAYYDKMKTFAKDIMSTKIHSVRESTTIADALKLLINKKITGMPVVNDEGKIIGIVSEFDIINQLSVHLSDRKELKSELFLSQIQYSRETHTVEATASLDKVVKSFLRHKFRRLPVVDENGILIGMITRRDLMRVFYYRAVLS